MLASSTSEGFHKERDKKDIRWQRSVKLCSLVKGSCTIGFQQTRQIVGLFKDEVLYSTAFECKLFDILKAISCYFFSV